MNMDVKMAKTMNLVTIISTARKIRKLPINETRKGNKTTKKGLLFRNLVRRIINSKPSSRSPIAHLIPTQSKDTKMHDVQINEEAATNQ